MHKNPRGFIALMSAVIISAILLLVVASGSFSGFNSRFNLFETEMKERSSALADACADQTLLELANDSSYVGNATTTIGSDACYTGPITTSGGQKSFKTRAYKSNAYTTLEVVVNASSLSVVSWQEVPVY